MAFANPKERAAKVSCTLNKFLGSGGERPDWQPTTSGDSSKPPLFIVGSQRVTASSKVNH